MQKKTRVALIYKKNYTFFNEEHFDKTTYYFFMKALRRNNNLDVEFFPVENNSLLINRRLTKFREIFSTCTFFSTLMMMVFVLCVSNLFYCLGRTESSSA